MGAAVLSNANGGVGRGGVPRTGLGQAQALDGEGCVGDERRSPAGACEVAQYLGDGGGGRGAGEETKAQAATLTLRVPIGKTVSWRAWMARSVRYRSGAPTTEHRPEEVPSGDR